MQFLKIGLQLVGLLSLCGGVLAQTETSVVAAPTNDGSVVTDPSITLKTMPTFGLKFEQLDTNKSGVLEYDEVKNRLGVGRNFELIDTNADRLVTRQELDDFRMKSKERIFNYHDTNKDGKVTSTEVVANVVNGLASRFKMIDTNNDGRLSPEEVQAYLAKVRADRMARQPGKTQ